MVAEIDGYPIISFKEMCNLGRCVIIICLMNGNIIEDVYSQVIENIPSALIYQLRDLFMIGKNLKKEEIVDNSEEGVWRDFCGNCIEHTYGALDNINIMFKGSNSKIQIGREVWVANRLNIICGNNATVTIGNKTSFDETTLYSSYGDIQIGEDCMFSYGVMIRNHDSHFIFDAETGNRINYSRPIKIKDHVWIGQNAILLGGFSIGSNSVVGAGSVSSSAFPGQVVIAGNSARVVREGVTWHRNMTWTENYDNIREIE